MRTNRPKLACWCTPEQSRVLNAALALVPKFTNDGRGVEVIGGPTDDPRSLLQASPIDMIVLGTLDEPLMGDAAVRHGTRMNIEAEAIAAARTRSCAVLSLEPIPGHALELVRSAVAGGGDIIEDDAAGDDADAGVILGQGRDSLDASFAEDAGPARTTTRPVEVAFAPLLRHSPTVRAAADVLEHLGQIRLVQIEAYCGVGEGSVGARVFDAADTCAWLLGVPDAVDAVAIAHPSIRGPLPDSLRGLRGDMTINLRFASGKAGSIVASDRAGRWQRTLTILGENGRVRIYDDGLVWYAEDGKVLDATRDQSRIRGSEAGDEPNAAYAKALAQQIARTLDARAAAGQSSVAEQLGPPVNRLAVLTITGAALLSARTGVAESPATIQRMCT